MTETTLPTTDNQLTETYAEGWRNHLRELVQYRYLLQNLVIRDLKVRYKNSILGVLWSLLNPLLMMLVFTLVFGVLWTNNSIPNYAVFILVGLLPWNFFRGSLMSGTVCITGSAALIKKVYFPRELLPLAALLSNFVNFLPALLILVVFLFATGIGLTIHSLWVLPLLVIQSIFTLGLALLLGALHVSYRDTAMVMDFALLAWFFLTPIVYPLDMLVGNTLTVSGINLDPAVIMRWVNPMASIIDGYRTVLWGSMSSGPGSHDPLNFIRTLVTALLVLLIGYIVFRRAQSAFGEKL